MHSKEEGRADLSRVTGGFALAFLVCGEKRGKSTNALLVVSVSLQWEHRRMPFTCMRLVSGIKRRISVPQSNETWKRTWKKPPEHQNPSASQTDIGTISFPATIKLVSISSRAQTKMSPAITGGVYSDSGFKITSFSLFLNGIRLPILQQTGLPLGMFQNPSWLLPLDVEVCSFCSPHPLHSRVPAHKHVLGNEVRSLWRTFP